MALGNRCRQRLHARGQRVALLQFHLTLKDDLTLKGRKSSLQKGIFHTDG